MAGSALATFFAVVYTVENWRGKRAWENCRRGLEAKGEVLDWSAYIPAPVPDDQNFYKAPKMQEWFVKDSLRDLRPSPGATTAHTAEPFALAPRKDSNLVVAEVKVVASNTPLGSQAADPVLRFDDPSARAQAAKVLSEVLGPFVISPRAGVVVARALEQIKPLHLVLQADAVPAVKELAAFFPSNPVTNLALAYSDTSYLQVGASGSNTFRILLKEPVYGAADYLSWTEPLTANFDLVRNALKRPYARIDCDYQQPFAIGIPNFIGIRTVVQLLSQRAQCYLLLSQSEAAWHELTLVHDLCQILMIKPSGKPLTLVGAMIHVAVIGLYADIVEDGLRLHAWREPELTAIERQLADIDLLAPVVEAFREERAATSRTFETMSRGELVKLFNFDRSGRLALSLMPRGWFYQNMALGAEFEQEVVGNMDATNQMVLPHQISELVRRLSPISQRRSAYNFLLGMALPNYSKAVQTAARNQTLVNQAMLACVLERYRLASGQYPETLDALTPRFIEKLPHDLIGGQPLKYRRTDGAGYLLYSVGWDEKDDGGVPGKSREEGDWVWELH